jgi:hypothetical protein
VPALAFTHVPLEHVWQAPHAVGQQNPSEEQMPVSHCAPVVHASPFATRHAPWPSQAFVPLHPLGCAPAAASVHVPTAPPVEPSHAPHGGVPHAMLQQKFCAQTIDAQSVFAEQPWPCDLRHVLPFTHVKPAEQPPLAHDALHDVMSAHRRPPWHGIVDATPQTWAVGGPTWVWHWSWLKIPLAHDVPHDVPSVTKEQLPAPSHLPVMPHAPPTVLQLEPAPPATTKSHVPSAPWPFASALHRLQPLHVELGSLQQTLSTQLPLAQSLPAVHPPPKPHVGQAPPPPQSVPVSVPSFAWSVQSRVVPQPVFSVGLHESPHMES